MAIETFLSLLQQSVGRASRSTALQPLVWLIGALVLALLFCLVYGAAGWVTVVIVSMQVITVLVFIGTYIYLVTHNIDATRSERFTLEKLALQQSRTGDDAVGFIESRARASAVLPATTVDTNAPEAE